MKQPTSDEVLIVVELIKPILAGRGRELQAAALAELLSLWLAGHRAPELREELLALHIQVVRDLTDTNAKIIWGERRMRQ